MQNLKMLLEEYQDDPETLTYILRTLDDLLAYIHSQGYYVYDFNPEKIILNNSRLTLSSFQNVIRSLAYAENGQTINIYQAAKIGLFTYNGMKADGNMSSKHLELIQQNIKSFNQNGQIPNDIYEYYEEIFLNGNITYLNEYLNKKEEAQGNKNNNIRKTKSTAVGRAFSNDDAAFINILFIPSLITLIYLVSLFIYVFIIKQ